MRINSPECSVLGLHDGLILRTSLRRTKVTAICFVHCSFKFWVFSGTCGQKLVANWHWLKFFLEKVSFVSTADKFVTNVWQTEQSSLTTLTMNGFTRNAKHGFKSSKRSNLAWSSTSSLTNYFCIRPLCGPASASSQKTFVLILTYRNWRNAFDNICL